MSFIIQKCSSRSHSDQLSEVQAVESPVSGLFARTLLKTPTVEDRPSLGNKAIKKEDALPLPITKHGLKVDQTAKEHGSYKQFSNEELAELELSVDRYGNLTVGSRQIVLTGKRELMYIMHTNGKIYVASAIEGAVYHSSFVTDSSDWPIAAGMLILVNGELKAIDRLSGHFAPPADREQLVLNELESMGAKIDHDAIAQHLQKLSLSSQPMERASILSPAEKQKKLNAILERRGLASSSSSPSSRNHIIEESAQAAVIPPTPKLSPRAPFSFSSLAVQEPARAAAVPPAPKLSSRAPFSFSSLAAQGSA